MDSEVVPSSLVVEIAPILRAAKEIEDDNPRVSYICRFYAFEKAHKLDPASRGRGVREFKIALVQRLEREDAATLGRRNYSDALEIQAYYKYYYGKYIEGLQNADKSSRTQPTNAYQNAAALFMVLKAVSRAESVKVADEILKAHAHVAEKAETYNHNILPLGPESSNQALSRYPKKSREARPTIAEVAFQLKDAMKIQLEDEVFQD
ncbi:hypothetical protein L2E82_29934 [Cichorium intybus]|uniref:Uncharacterized protein n=1 Tax=Cichorium intybus TaxID=13427 RepID=A0ACB9CZM3_CICIN|nr:hypothetical protein L2E82_29934 [Cichorium intybus]